MKKNQRTSTTNRKIVSLKLDANFYFERALHSLHTYDYDKALRYFRRAVELEPNNPVNHCNLAGILSEMEQYEESNEVLQHVLYHVDPTMDECYFYMANNYANMGFYELAEEYTLYYLKSNTNGEYAEDAYEMLKMLSEELERPVRQVEDIEDILQLGKQKHVRTLLEQGKFMEAIHRLEDELANNPDATVIRNNLALAYYYTGKLPQAMEQVRLVLEKEPFNIHALCNAALFYHQMGEAEGLQQIITLLRKMRPIVPEHMYKLAMTMGILGEDETAYQLFGKLNDRLMVNDPVVVHYTALAAFHTERIQQAERLWKQLQKIDPVSKVADYFLDQLTLYKQNKIGLARYPYYYQLHEDPVKPVDLAELINGHQNDPSLRSTLFWALKFSDATAKNRVIQAMGLIGDSEVEETLRAFLLESGESKESKLMALFILQYMNARAPFEIMIGKRRRSLSASQAMNTLPEWMGSWLEVLSILRRNISGDDTGIYWLEARSIWLKCLMQCYPHLPTLRKTEGWAAALEYWIFKKNHLQVSQMEVARKYHVSASTVSKRIKELRQTIEEHFNG